MKWSRKLEVLSMMAHGRCGAGWSTTFLLWPHYGIVTNLWCHLQGNKFGISNAAKTQSFIKHYQL